MLVPPALSHTVTHSGGFTSIWIDPYHLAVPEPSRAHRLDLAQVGRLLIDLDAEFDPDRLRRAISDTFGEPPSIDPRLQQVLAALDEGTGLDELATRADLSPRRLRQLTHAGSLATLRRWHRLRNAGFLFPFHPASEVAALTDFADQAHLIRTTLALTGRTPGSLHGRQGR